MEYEKKTLTDEVVLGDRKKRCVVCGVVFERPPNRANRVWESRKVCGNVCQKKMPGVGFQKEHIAYIGSERTRFVKGHDTWNKGTSIQTNDALLEWRKTHPEPHNKGKKLSKETIEKIKKARALQENSGFQKGEKHWNWDGGKTALRKLVQGLYQYKKWRSDVFKRDNYTCQDCGKRGGILNADHITPYSVIIKNNKVTNIDDAKKCQQLWDVDNGRTLCVSCHRQTDTYGNRIKTNADRASTLGN